MDKCAGLVNGIGVHLNDGQLVAAQSRNHGHGASRVGDPLAHRASHDIAGLVAEGTVEVLETIQIDEMQRKAGMGALGAFQLLGEPLVKGVLVEQAREVVMAAKSLCARLIERQGLAVAAQAQNEQGECRQHSEDARHQHEPWIGQYGRSGAGLTPCEQADRVPSRVRYGNGKGWQTRAPDLKAICPGPLRFPMSASVAESRLFSAMMKPGNRPGAGLAGLTTATVSSNPVWISPAWPRLRSWPGEASSVAGDCCSTPRMVADSRCAMKA